MKTLTFNLWFLTFIILNVSAEAQAPRAFSLQQAQEYALENNFQLKNAFYDIEIAKKRVKENTSIGLPQIEAAVDYMDYLNIPTTLIPAEFFGGDAGTYAPVRFGVRYNASASVSASQLLYSGQYLVGLQTANAFLETSKQKFVQEKMNVRDQIAESYIAILILEESNRLRDSIYKSVVSMVNEAEAALKQGLIEDISLDQLKLDQANLEADITTNQNQKLYAYNMLKFLMGVKETDQIQLTDDLGSFLNAVGHDILMNQNFDYKRNIAYVMFDKQDYLVTMQYKLSRTAYQPSLAAFISSSYNAQRNQWNFFDSKAPWYNTTNWGLSLKIPIWSSGSRKYAVDQASLNVKKMKTNREQLQTSLTLEEEVTKNDFNKTYLVFNNKKQGLKIAQKIYNVTVSKYRQGVSASTELNQKYTQLMVAEAEYTQALFSLLRAKIKLSTLLEKV